MLSNEDASPRVIPIPSSARYCWRRGLPPAPPGMIATRAFRSRISIGLSEAGLLALTVPTALGGLGAGARDAVRIVNIFGKADASTALVLSMHYIQHLLMARSTRWPGRLVRKLARETVEGVALINALRVEPDLGSPSRGGLPATIARRTETGWRLTGRKIYSTGAPILKWYTVWAKTDEPNVRVGLFLVPAGLPGTRIVETWDHLGLARQRQP